MKRAYKIGVFCLLALLLASVCFPFYQEYNANKYAKSALATTMRYRFDRQYWIFSDCADYLEGYSKGTITIEELDAFCHGLDIFACPDIMMSATGIFHEDIDALVGDMAELNWWFIYRSRNLDVTDSRKLEELVSCYKDLEQAFSKGGADLLEKLIRRDEYTEETQAHIAHIRTLCATAIELYHSQTNEQPAPLGAGCFLCYAMAWKEGFSSSSGC